jgi:hypothetical protein
MKKIISTILLAIAVTCLSAQITLEHSYADNQGLSVVRLENSGSKYVQYDWTNKEIKLYNTDHSLFKTILLPTITNPTGYPYIIDYISENLFNLDNKIELIVFNTDGGSYPNSSNIGYIRIINEDGTILFSGDSMKVVPQYAVFGMTISSFIFNTTNGTKMILYSNKINDKGFKVYSLPGTLTNAVKQNDLNTFEQKAFPNPTSDHITIPYDLDNCLKGQIEIYNIKGKLIKKLEIDNTFSNIILDTSDYGTGTYVYIIKTDKKIMATNKFIISK